MSLNRLRIVYVYPMSIKRVSRHVFVGMKMLLLLLSIPETTWNGLTWIWNGWPLLLLLSALIVHSCAVSSFSSIGFGQGRLMRSCY